MKIEIKTVKARELINVLGGEDTIARVFKKEIKEIQSVSHGLYFKMSKSYQDVHTKIENITISSMSEWVFKKDERYKYIYSIVVYGGLKKQIYDFIDLSEIPEKLTEITDLDFTNISKSHASHIKCQILSNVKLRLIAANYDDLTYAEAKEVSKELDNKLKEVTKVLDDRYNQYKYKNGLMPDNIKFSEEYKKGRLAANKAFKNIQDFNKFFVKKFKKEIQNDRRIKYQQ